MKNRLYILLVAFTAGITGLRAQSITWDVLRDDPFDIKNLSVAIDPFFIDLNGHNGYAFGWGARLDHMMGKRLLINGDIRTGFGTNLYRKSNDNTRNYFAAEGGLGLIFFNKMKRKNVPIILSQTTSGNTRTTVYIKGGVPANCRSIIALRGGLSEYTNTLDYSKLNDTLLTVNDATYAKAKTSNVFKDTVSAKVASDLPQLGGIALTTVYAGLNFRSIRNLLIDVSGWGVRGNIRYSDFYIDFLYAPVIGLKKFANPDGSEYKVDYIQKTHFGWRFGWFVRKPKEQGVSMKLEMGSRPGFKAPTNGNIPLNKNNLYCTFTLGLYVPFKVKPFYSGT